MAQTISLKFVIDSKGAVTGAKSMVDGLEKVKIKAGQSAKSVNKLGGSMHKLGTIARAMGLSIASAFGAVQFIQVVDKMKLLENRMRIVTRSTGELVAVQKKLAEISVATRSDLIANSDLFARLALSTKGQGVATKQLLDLTKSLNQAIVLSGATAREAEAGLIQLSQGLASGTLRGDELRSVLEQLPAVADIIARSLGVTRGRLRELGTEGAITAQVVLEAFEKLGGGLQKDFDTTATTVGQTLTNLKTVAIGLAVDFDKATGATQFFKDALNAFSGVLKFAKNHMEGFKKVIGFVGATIAAFSTIVLVRTITTLFALTTATSAATGGFFAMAGSALFASSALTTLAIATGFGVLLPILGSLVASLFFASSELDKLGEKSEGAEEPVTILSSATDLLTKSTERYENALKGSIIAGGDMVSRLEVMRAGVENLHDQIALLSSDELAQRRIADLLASPNVTRDSLKTSAGISAFDALSVEGSVLSLKNEIFILNQEAKETLRLSKELDTELKKNPYGFLAESLGVFKRGGEESVKALEELKVKNEAAAAAAFGLLSAENKLNQGGVTMFRDVKKLTSSLHLFQSQMEAVSEEEAISLGLKERIADAQKKLDEAIASNRGVETQAEFVSALAKEYQDARVAALGVASGIVVLNRALEKADSDFGTIPVIDSTPTIEEVGKILDAIQAARDKAENALQAGTSTQATQGLISSLTNLNDFMVAEMARLVKEAEAASKRISKAFAKGLASVQTETDKLTFKSGNVGKSSGEIEDAKLILDFKKKITEEEANANALIKNNKEATSDEVIAAKDFLANMVRLTAEFKRQVSLRRQDIDNVKAAGIVEDIAAQVEQQKLLNASDKEAASFQIQIAKLKKEGVALSWQQVLAIAVANHDLFVQKGLWEDIKKATAEATKKTNEDEAKSKGLNDKVLAMQNETKVRQLLIEGKKDEAAIEEILFSLGIKREKQYEDQIKLIEFEIQKQKELTIVEAEAIKKKEQAAELAGNIEQAFATAFEDAILGAKSFEDALKGLIETLIQLAFRQIVMNQLIKAFSFTPGVGNNDPGGTDSFLGLGGGATGAIFGGSGEVIPFAKGGLITDTAIFPLSGGQIGVAGEAGIEASLPLTRTANGDLGINAAGLNKQQPINVTFNLPNIRTVDDFGKSKRQLSRDANRVLQRR